ncbi:hypothetical protein ATCC90586_003154 [Pythium insidiosum]|nr:hypothetical protein ATCC90586_003154 [Pythium insidiosum]
MLLPGPISSFVELNLLRFAGKVSYSMYLLHYFFVIHTEFVQRQRGYDRFFAVFGLSFLLATASYYAVERPCQILSRRLSKVLHAQAREAEILAIQAEQNPQNTDSV